MPKEDDDDERDGPDESKSPNDPCKSRKGKKGGNSDSLKKSKKLRKNRDMRSAPKHRKDLDKSPIKTPKAESAGKVPRAVLEGSVRETGKADANSDSDDDDGAASAMADVCASSRKVKHKSRKFNKHSIDTLAERVKKREVEKPKREKKESDIAFVKRNSKDDDQRIKSILEGQAPKEATSSAVDEVAKPVKYYSETRRYITTPKPEPLKETISPAEQDNKENEPNEPGGKKKSSETPTHVGGELTAASDSGRKAVDKKVEKVFPSKIKSLFARSRLTVTNRNGGTIMADGRPFWLSAPKIPQKERDDATQDDIPVSADTILKVSQGATELKQLPPDKRKFNYSPYHSEAVLESRDALLFTAEMLFANTARTVLNLIDISDDRTNKRRKDKSRHKKGTIEHVRVEAHPNQYTEYDRADPRTRSMQNYKRTGAGVVPCK